MKPTATKPSSLLSIPLLCAFFAMPVFTALADNVTWTGGANDGKWETGDNWDTLAMPTDSDVAVFPDVDTTVTITGAVKAQYVRTAGISDATITLTGPGSLEITSKVFVQSTWTSANFVFDVDVSATPASDTPWISLFNNNTFCKNLDVSTHKLCIMSGSTISLVGNAQATAKYINMGSYSNNSLFMSDNAVLNVTGTSEDFMIKEGATLSVTDNAALTVVKALVTEPGANVTFTGGSIVTGGAVTHTNLLAANAGTYLESKLNYSGAFFPFSETVDEWVLHGGTIVNKAGNSSDGYNRIDLSGLTNATRTISGSGLLKIGQFYTKDASSLTIRLNGPDFYTRYLSRSGYGNDIKFVVSGGSTVGAWGGSPTLEYWTTVIDGAATFDTTDGDNRTTARTIKITELRDCNGVLTVKGNGTVSLTASFTQPNLGIVGTDNSTIAISSGKAAYAVGDIVLHDSATLDSGYYMGHQDTSDCVASLTMDGNSELKVKRYIQISGDATLSGNATAVIRNANTNSQGELVPDKGAIFSCSNLSLSDNASLVVTGMVSAATLSMSGNAHLAFTAGTGFTAGAAFGNGNWTMEITIPSGYEAGIRPVVKGANFGGDFAEHVTLLGDTAGWSAQTVGDNLVLYKEVSPSGIEWIGKSTTSDNWSDAANWNGGNVPTADDIVAFGGLDRQTPYDDTVGTVSGLVFRASAGPFVVTGSVERLSLTADTPSRGDATPDTAAIVSYSDFDQTIALPLDFGAKSKYVLAAGGGALEFPNGFTATGYWDYFIIGGDVRVGGESSVNILSFNNKHCGGVNPRLTLLPGCNFMVGHQYFRSFSEEEKYAGSIVIEEGAVMTVQDGDCCFFHPAKESVVDGTLIVKGSSGSENGRLVATQNEQYYVGKGSIFADSARAGRNPEVANHYINIGGTLKLYMNGDWMTATYRVDGSKVMQDPNYPTRFRMKDGTTLGATADWTYGPAADAYNVIPNALTPDARKSIMVGTVTVNTQNPTNDIAHTITFVDPLDASAANLVKVGAGSLVFNPTNSCPSQVSNLTVNAGTVLFKGDSSPTVGGVVANAGTVRFDVGPALGDLTISNGATASFAAAPTLSGALTIASTDANFCVDGVAATAAWEPLATAADIVGPDSETKWKTADGMRRFKIVSEVAGKLLYGAQASGFTVILR